MISKHPLTDCENCPLYNGAYYQQPAIEGAKYLFVGSSPTPTEGFKGGFLRSTDAGKLIQSVCSVHQIDRDAVNYTTAVRCSGLSDLPLSDRRKAIAACNPALMDDLDRNDPVAVVALGGEANLALTGSRQAISAARVGPAKYSDITETVLVPTVSPWACIQNESQFQFLVTDIAKLVYPAPVFTPPEWELVTTEAEAVDLILDCMGEVTSRNEKVELTVDIEVAMEKDISFEHPERYEMLCIGVAFGDSPVVVFAEGALTKKFWDALAELCKYTEVTAHNGKFDLNGLRPLCGKVDLGFDTMLAHYVLDERTGIHGLKYLAQEYLGAPAYDDEITALMGKSKDFGSIPKEILYKYNAYDVHCTRELAKLLKKRLAETGLTHVAEFLVSVSNMLQDVEHFGMTIDQSYLGELDHTYTLNMAAQIDKLKESAGQEFNPRSYQQIKKFLLDHGVEVPSTSAEVLQQVLDRIKEVAKENDGTLPANLLVVFDMLSTLMKYRKDQKLYGTYIDGTKQRLYFGKVHPTYLIHGTTTGRLSARNPNTQNIASSLEIKRMFVSRGPEFSLVHADYSQAELRVLSYFAKDRYFRDIFNDGTRDLFDELIVDTFPGSIKEIESEFDWKMKRRKVKTVVYGLNYGRTQFGVAHGLGIEVKEAEEIMERFFSTIPEIIDFQEWVKDRVRSGHDLVTPFGRRRRYSLITKQNENKVMNEALAFMPQSTASDCTVAAAIRVDTEFKRVWGSAPSRPQIINLVHDDIITDALDEDTEQVGEILKRHMIEVAEEMTEGYVKFDVAANSGKSWDGLH